MTSEHARRWVGSGAVWEDLAGYARAVRVGDAIHVSGTVAVDAAGQTVGVEDAGAQAHFIFQKIEAAIGKLGGRREDIVRTRMFVADIADWEAVARVHGEWFADIRPAATLVEARMIGDEYKVEIEAEAVVGSGASITQG